MNEYEIVIEHIQQVATIAKRFEIADKPEVLEYLTLVQLQAVKRDRVKIVDTKIQEVEGEMERLDGELKLIGEAKYEAKQTELENIVHQRAQGITKRPELEKIVNAPKETLGSVIKDKYEEFYGHPLTKKGKLDDGKLTNLLKEGEALLAIFNNADPEKGKGAAARINAVVEVDKLITKVKKQYYYGVKEGKNERTNKKAEETFGRLSALKFKMLG